MKKITLILFATISLAFSACGTLHPATSPADVMNTPPLSQLPDGLRAVTAVATGADINQPSGIVGLVRSEIDRKVEFIRTDLQNGLDAAIAGKDDIGIQCHSDSLALLEKFTSAIPTFVPVKVTGIASAAENVRLKTRAAQQARATFDQNRAALNDLRDRCAPVYPVMSVMKPLLDLMGIVGF